MAERLGSESFDSGPPCSAPWGTKTRPYVLSTPRGFYDVWDLKLTACDFNIFSLDGLLDFERQNVPFEFDHGPSVISPPPNNLVAEVP